MASYAAYSDVHQEDDELLPEALQIREKLKDGYPRSPFNILVLGSPGAGKSSVINSLITAIDKNGYKEHSIKGTGGTRGTGRTDGAANAVTSGLTAIRMFENEMDYKTEKKEFKCKPVFWDFPGLMNADEKKLLQMILKGTVYCSGQNIGVRSGLQLFFDVSRKLRDWFKGHLPTDTALGQMRSWRYSFWNWWTGPASADKRMHLIMYVHAANVTPADALLESIVDLVRTTADMTYETTTMLVITHEDKVGLTDKELTEATAALEGKNADNTEMEEAKRKKKQSKLDEITSQAARRLKMKDAWERIVQVSCYSQDTAGDDEKEIKRRHHIDKQMCKLWKKILQPNYYKRFEKT